ncbi:MAG: RNA methyltransferase, partial [Erysipelotrichia bacterium]|nr:RNA methyltransferase [Erysipelotrichia bacterium]
VEDPFNFGFVLRSLYAAGVDAIIMPPRNWTSAASTLAKSSAGASEYLNMVISEDIENTLLYLKQHHFQIVCANRDAKAIEMYDYDYTQKICICIGGEKRGLSKSVLKHSDQNVYIPYQNDFRNALSAASASTILAYEVLRQRKNKKK